METTMKYEEAVKELETIVRRMEANELDIDTLSTELKRAQELLRLCKDKLTKADEEVKKVLKNNRYAIFSISLYKKRVKKVAG